MPLFIIERELAEKLEGISSDAAAQIKQVNEEIGVQWLFSFLRADGKKTYCLYEAKDPEILMEHARLLGLPADVIVEVSQFSP